MMSKSTSMRAMQLVAAAALLAVTSLAQAQYVWIDAKGIKQFSDQAPPGSVPRKNILKAPGAVTLVETPAALEAKAGNAAAPASTIDREADYRKRTQEKAAADAKAAALAANAAQRAAACEAARIRNTELSSGKRMRTNTPDRAIMDDNARAAEQAQTNAALAACSAGT
jgi:hypothetical protein